MDPAPRRLPRHRIIDNFLPDDLHGRLLAFALASIERFSPTRVGPPEGEGVDKEVRRSWSAKGGLGALKQEFLAAVDRQADEIRESVGVPPFPLLDHEVELAAHRDGCFYKPHIDTFAGPSRSASASDRVLTLVYYFHRQPRVFQGGELALYPFSGADPELLEARDNRLVAFASFARHEVRPIACPGDAWEDARFAVNCWFLRKRAS